jgi:hypothetical protein
VQRTFLYVNTHLSQGSARLGLLQQRPAHEAAPAPAHMNMNAGESQEHLCAAVLSSSLLVAAGTLCIAVVKHLFAVQAFCSHCLFFKPYATPTYQRIKMDVVLLSAYHGRPGRQQGWAVQRIW